MKKILAVLLALAMVFALAACGSKTEETTTAAPDTTAATEAATEEATEAVSEEATEAASEEATEATTEETTTEEETTKAAGLNSTDAEEVVAFYNEAVIKTNDGKAPNGKQTMKLDGDISGDGALGAVLKVAMPIIQSTLEKNSTSTDYIPGKGKLTAADVKSAKATSANGVTTITLTIKEQTDGPTADPDTAGPVARATGTLGNVDNAVNELGAEIYSGKDTISLRYSDCTITCKVDEKTGLITSGNWHYKVNVTIGNAELKLGLKLTAKNLKAIIDYTVAI